MKICNFLKEVRNLINSKKNQSWSFYLFLLIVLCASWKVYPFTYLKYLCTFHNMYCQYSLLDVIIKCFLLWTNIVRQQVKNYSERIKLSSFR